MVTEKHIQSISRAVSDFHAFIAQSELIEWLVVGGLLVLQANSERISSYKSKFLSLIKRIHVGIELILRTNIRS